jgi:hypothetical protein
LRLALGAGDRGGSGGFSGGGLDGLVGEGDPAAGDDQRQEQAQGGGEDDDLDDGGAALGRSLAEAYSSQESAHRVSLSTGADALWVMLGVHPGITDRVVPVTTTVAVVAVRLLVTVTPAQGALTAGGQATNADAALWPAVVVPFWAAAARAPSCAAAIATVRPW